jgi:hypothetical protein
MDVQLKGLEKALMMFDDKIVRKAARMTINEGLTTGRKVARQQICKDWNLKSARVNKELTNFKRSSNDHLIAIVQAKGRPISLVHYGAKFKRGKRLKSGRWSKTGGVTVTVERGKKKHYSHAFVAKMANGNIGVFERSGQFGRRGNEKLEKIKNRATVTIATMFNQPRVMTPTVSAIDKRLIERFDHHLTRLIK